MTRQRRSIHRAAARLALATSLVVGLGGLLGTPAQSAQPGSSSTGRRVAPFTAPLTDLKTGKPISLQQALAGNTKPVLYWFWAPH